ncbi:hypothetical protein [Salinicoccus roseus]|uniref:Uncharacterized protein n=1 Tax=Salinicoccus roseus TaxID=45670 RepID=A0A265E770_9STAP|nr:hypothetical protein [Salinicoccus roseus]OZT77098.1 hypothetical protein CFN03_08460 [Salinicoccus roseus]
MAEDMSVREQIEAVRRKYDVLIENEEYRLETQDLTDKQRQKIMSKIVDLQNKEEYEVRVAQMEPNVMMKAGESMSNAGDNMIRSGCLITLWVFAFPIMLPIWLLKKTFGNKK